jgi:hypothetical protein
MSEGQALETIGKELSLPAESIREGLEQCRKTLHVDQELYDQIRELKAEMNGNLKVYAMSMSYLCANICEP